MTLKIEKTLTLNPMCVKHTKNGRAAARTAGKEPRARGGGGGGAEHSPWEGGHQPRGRNAGLVLTPEREHAPVPLKLQSVPCS